jgi:hypothetical protein
LLPSNVIRSSSILCLNFSLSYTFCLTRAPLSSIPKLALLPDASSIPVQVSASSVLPAVCYLDTHRSTVSLFFNQSYLFSIGPEATFQGYIKALSVKYWRIRFHNAGVTGQSEPSVTLKLNYESTIYICPASSALPGVYRFLESVHCTGFEVGTAIYPVTKYQMIGPFSFFKFSMYGSVDNTSWVLIDSRAAMTSVEQNCAGSCSQQTPLWAKPFVVSSSAQFIQVQFQE